MCVGDLNTHKPIKKKQTSGRHSNIFKKQVACVLQENSQKRRLSISLNAHHFCNFINFVNKVTFMEIAFCLTGGLRSPA